MTEYSNEELATRAASGDKNAMSILYEQNKGLIISKCKQAYKFCNSPDSAEFEELNQEASYAFILSVPKFNPEKELKFSTFIGKCIFNYMVDYLKKYISHENNERIIDGNTSFSCDTDLFKYKGKSNILEQRYWQLKTGMFSISAEKAYFRIYFLETIKNALDLLSPRQNRFISYLYGLGGEDEEYFTIHTLTDTAYHFHLTEAEAIKIEKSSLKIMRRYCHDKLSTIIKSSTDDTIFFDELNETINKLATNVSADTLEELDWYEDEFYDEEDYEDDIAEFDLSGDYNG